MANKEHRIEIADQKALNSATAGSSQEYTRQAAFEPSHGVSGIGQAFGAASAASDASAAIGASIASDLALENARATGMKMGQTNPGVEPLPAFTKSDKAFVEAYRQEEHNTVTYNGTKFLQDAAQIVHQDPTPQNLVQFQKNSESTLGNLVSQTTEFNRSNVERSLSSQYQAQFHSLSNAVEARNRKIMADNFKASSDLNEENLITAGFGGNWGEIERSYADQKINITHGLNTETISKEDAAIRLKSLDIQEGVAKNIKPLMDAERNGKGDLYLSDFSKSQTKYSPTEKEAIGQQLVKHLSAQRSLTSGQQQIYFTHAMMDLETNQLTPSSIEEYRTKLDGQQYANFERAYAAKQMKTLQSQNLLQDMKKDFGNVAKMRENWTDGQFSDVFMNMVNQQESAYQAQNGKPQPYPLIAQAALAQQIKRENPVVTRALSDTIGYGSPQEATEAAQAIRMLENNNPIALKSMSPETKMVSELFNLHSMDRTKTAEESLTKAREDVYNVDDSMRADRILKLNEYQRVNNLKDPSAKLKVIKGALSEKSFLWGHKDTVIPDGVITEFDKLWTNFAATGSNIEVAKKMALDELGRIYTPTRINNRSEVMRMSPESVLTNEGNYIQNSKTLALNDVIKNNQELAKSGGFVMAELEWVDDPFKEPDDSKDSTIVKENKAIERKLMGAKPKSEFNIIDDELVKGDTLIKYNGKVRKVFAESDAVTSLSGDRKPSWVFYVMDDYGNKEPIMSTDHKGGVARWRPENERLLSAEQQKDKILLEQARRYRDLANSIDTEESITRMIQHGAGYY